MCSFQSHSNNMSGLASVISLILQRETVGAVDVVAHLRIFCSTETLLVELQHSLTSREKRTLLDLFLVKPSP